MEEEEHSKRPATSCGSHGSRPEKKRSIESSHEAGWGKERKEERWKGGKVDDDEGGRAVV